MFTRQQMIRIEKNVTKRFLLITFIVTLFSFALFAQQTSDIKSDIQNFVKTSDINFIAKYFKGYTEVEIPGFSGVVNHVKAQMLIKDYIKNKNTGNPVFKKEGFIKGSYFLILKFSSDGKERNLYMLFKKEKQQYILQKIEID